MKHSSTRENLLSVIGTVATVGCYVLLVYLPGERACQAARQDIARANRDIDEAPMLIQQSAVQQQKRSSREELLRQHDRLLDDDDQLHDVLQKVANLAHSAGLRMDRLQPQAAISHETYRVIPHQVTVTGKFRQLSQFLYGLEADHTLYAVERLHLKREVEQAGDDLKADVTFSVFVKRMKFADFAEKSDSSAQTQADES